MQKTTVAYDPEARALQFAALLQRCVPSSRLEGPLFGHKGMTLDNLASVSEGEAREKALKLFEGVPVTPEYVAFMIQVATPRSTYIPDVPLGVFPADATAQNVLDILGVDFNERGYGVFEQANSKTLEWSLLTAVVQGANPRAINPIWDFIDRLVHSYEKLHGEIFV